MLPSTQARFHGGVSDGGGGGPPRHHKPDHHGKEGSSAFSLAALWRKISGQEEAEDQKRKEEEEKEVDYRKEAEDVQEQNKQMRVITWVGLGLNILLGTGKAIAGTMGNSQALVADAVHSFTDGISDIVTLWAIHMMQLPHNAQYPYGHGKFETMGTFLVAVTLVATGVGIGGHAVDSLMNMSTEVPSNLALYGALGSILFKEALYHATVRIGKRAGSELLIANAWHHRTDAISSVVALFGVAGAQYGVAWLDPVAGLAVGVMIVKMGVEMGMKSVRELTDASIEHDMLNYMEKLIRNVEGVVEARKIRARKMGTYSIVDVKIQVDHLLSVSAAHQVAKRVRLTLLDAVPQVNDVMVHVDPEPPQSQTLQTLMRPQSEIYQDVVAKVDLFPEVYLSYMCCHYYNMRLTVEVDLLFGDETISLKQAQELAKKIQKEVLAIKDVHHADIMVNLTLQSANKEREWNNWIKQQRMMRARMEEEGGKGLGDLKLPLSPPSLPSFPAIREAEYPQGRPGHMWK